MKICIYISLFFTVFLLGSCTPDEQVTAPQTTFGAFEVQENNAVLMSGVITASTATDLQDLLEAYPSTTRIDMGNVNSASSHEAAFAAARIVRSNQLNIHINNNSTIRKEATNFFLGGIKRTKGEDVQIGVSAWKDDLGLEATDYDFGDPAHLPWINFFVEMEYQYQLATDFYNFYIYAAEADDIYFLSDDQLNTFDIIN